MAAAKPAVKIPIEIEKDKAQRQLKDFNKSMTKSFAVGGLAVVGVTEALKLMGRALGGAMDLMKESITLAGIQEKAETDLKNAIKLRQEFTDKEFESLQRFNSEVQQATAIGDEALLALQKQLTLQGVEKGVLEDVTKAVIGLASVKNTGLSEAATVVTRVVRGETQALKEQGIIAKDVEDAMSQLKGMYALAAKETETFAGQQALLSANFGDLLEEIGKVFTESDALKGVVQDMNTALLDLSAIVKQNAPAMKEYFSAAIVGARGLYRVIMDDIIPAARSVGETLARAFAPFLAPLAPAVGVLGALSARVIEQGSDYPAVPISGEGFRFDRDRELAGAGTVLADPGYRAPPDWNRRARRPSKPDTASPYLKEAADMDAHVIELRKYQSVSEEVRLETVIFMENYHKELRRLEDKKDLQDKLRVEKIDFEQDVRRAQIDEDEAIGDKQKENLTRLYQDLAKVGASGVANLFAEMTQGALEGELKLDEAMKQFFGSMLQGVGQALISLGSATMIAAIASTPAPIAWLTTGGPVAGVAAGLGIMAAGGMLMGVGGYVGSPSAPGQEADKPPSADDSMYRPTASVADRGRMYRSTPESTPTIYNINFNGALPGSERRIARTIRDLLDGKPGEGWATS